MFHKYYPDHTQSDIEVTDHVIFADNCIYVMLADFIRINNLGISYAFGPKKYLRNLILSVYTENLLIWTAYKGGDPGQMLFDYAGSSGLDYFNLPSTKTFGFNVSVQF